MTEIDSSPAHQALEGVQSRLDPVTYGVDSSRPTRVRYVVLLLLILHYANTYMDRVIIAGAAPVIRKELHLTNVMLGVVFSAFSISYVLFQVPTGWLADKFGPRRVLAGIVTWWCVFTMATASAWNVTSLMVFRFLFGAGQAGAFPSATRALTRWLPSTERGFAQGITHSASRLAAAVTPAIVAVTVVEFGWRWAFLVLGAAGTLWAIVWFWYYRDTPESHAGVNSAELAIIRASSGARDSKSTPHAATAKGGAKVPWRVLLRSSNMWMICLAWWGHSYMFWIYITWFPTYLLENYHFSLARSGILAGLPLLAGAVANTVGGWSSDRLVAKKGLRFGRRAIAVIGFSTAISCTVFGVLAKNPYWAVALLTMAMAGLELTVGVAWAVTIDVGGDFAGTVSALMNTFGQTGGALSPIVFGVLVQWTGRWELPFLLASAVLVGSGLLWLKIDPEKSVLT
jgi:sugar phosphate permease